MDVSTIRAALGDALRTIVSDPSLIVHDHVPDSTVVPCAYVVPDRVTFDSTFVRGMDEITFSLMLIVSRADDPSSQALMDGYLRGSGPASVKAAVEADDTLAGTVHDVRVVEVGAYRWVQVGETRYLGAEFSVAVIGPGT